MTEPKVNTYSIAYWKRAISKEFGITVMDSSEMKWGAGNLSTAFNCLNMADNVLRGKLKSVVVGATFTITDGGSNYYGYTTTNDILFHVKDDKTLLPEINFLHEIGHLIDFEGKINKFSSQISGNPSWVDDRGYVDADDLNSYYEQPVQAKYIENEDHQTAEYWADAFANYAGGNIDFSKDAGRDMATFVQGQLDKIIYLNPKIHGDN